MMYFLYPWGLISLASLGGVLFLHFYVFRGKRIEVSALFLWGSGQSLRTEGQKRRRPPITWPLILELLAALLLSLLVAGLGYSRVAERQHLAVVLDSSASMNAAEGQVSFRERANEKLLEIYRILGKEGRISLIRSGGGVELIGGRPLAQNEAEALLRDWEPSDPPHSFRPAIELARSLVKEKDKVVLLTDGAGGAAAGSRANVVTLGIGQPIENTGWVAAHWIGKSKLFALVKHFGKGKPKKTVTLAGGGRKLGTVTADFARRDALPLVFNIPEDVSSVSIELPADGLANDNVLRITRPQRLVLPAKLDVKHPVLDGYLRKALVATGKVELLDPAWLALSFARLDESQPAAPAGHFEVRFHIGPKDKARPFVGPYFINHLAAAAGLIRGVDLHGVIWAADPAFKPADADAEVLVSVGDVPLVVMTGGGAVAEQRLIVNIVPGRSSLFRAPAWPVLVSNIVDYVHERSPGLKRFSFRLGEGLSFRRPKAWEGKVTVEAPDGARVEFDGDHIYYGRFEKDGIYTVLAKGVKVASLDVNLLAEAESDLTKASSFGSLKEVEAALLPERERRSFHRELLVGAAAMLLCCWLLLERRKV